MSLQLLVFSIIIGNAFAFAILGGRKATNSKTLLQLCSHESKPQSQDVGNLDQQRRKALNLVFSSAAYLTAVYPGESSAIDTSDGDNMDYKSLDESLTIPLQWIPSLNAYVIYFYLYNDQPEKFGAILDTGSPFLTVPSYCNRFQWGCYRPELTKDSGYKNTVERFDNKVGTVVWRKSSFSFANATGRMMGPKDLVFGVLDESLMDGPGGVFFGLIKNTKSSIRPSFLGQLNVNSFKIDLKSKIKTLTLKTKPQIQRNDYISLNIDLYTKYKDPVIHYCAKACSIEVNGKELLDLSETKRIFEKKRKPTYVIFDTGVTGMVVNKELFEERYIAARRNREKNLWGSVKISFKTNEGEIRSLVSQKPIVTPLGEQPWPGFNANLIVVGLAFLDNHVVTVDIEEQRMHIS